VKRIKRGGGPRGGDSEADLFDVRYARRTARAKLKLGEPVSTVVLWLLSPEWTMVGVKSTYRGLANGLPCNSVSGEVESSV
jgi:hypothetical protein